MKKYLKVGARVEPSSDLTREVRVFSVGDGPKIGFVGGIWVDEILKSHF